MEKSESIKEIGTALAKFQAEIHNPSNTAVNPFFKSKYAPLAEVLNVVRPIASKYGISIIQNPIGNGESVTVTTIIIHSSGEWLQTGNLSAKPEKNTAQAMGSIITYLRRYQLSSLLGVSSEDDNDGNEKDPEVTKPKHQSKVEPKPLLIQLNEKLKLAKWNSPKAINGIKEKYQVFDLQDMTDEQMQDLIKLCEEHIKNRGE